MEILRSIDIEDEVRQALTGHVTAYCRPLPKAPSMPCILVSKVGGYDSDKIDTFEVVLDARAEDESSADELLRTAVGILRKVAENQTTALRYVAVNSSGSWGVDPVRPDLAMCSARLSVTAHLENVEVK